MQAGSRKLCIGAAALALGLGGCGGDDDGSEDAGATGAQGATGFAIENPGDITAEDFLVKLLPEKEVAIEAVVATEPACESLKVEPSLVLVISDAASNADPGTPLTELVTAEC